ncbi:RING finger and transmembrane domain-containing protein 2-like [Argonauta hians]
MATRSPLNNSQLVYYFRGLPYSSNLTSSLGSQVQNILPLLRPSSHSNLRGNDLLGSPALSNSLSNNNSTSTPHIYPQQSMVINMDSLVNRDTVSTHFGLNGTTSNNDSSSINGVSNGDNLNGYQQQLQQPQQQQRQQQQQQQQSPSPQLQQQQDSAGLRNISQGQHGHTHHGHNNDIRSDWRIVFKLLQKSGIFAVILFIKVMYDHRLGLLIFFCLFGTFCYANRGFDRQTHQLISRQGGAQHKSLLSKLWLILFLLGNIMSIYIVFADQKLYRTLYLQLPVMEKLDIWALAWIIGITDFVLKFICIILKSFVAMWPRKYIPYRRRGKYFLLIEQMIYFYGCLTPIVPWVYFLLDDSYGGQWFSTFLLVIYTAFKMSLVYVHSFDLWRVCKKINKDMNLGTKPTADEVQTAGHSCPICHDDFANPIKLTCQHIFCEDCVSLWFDREQTCPMCRTRISDSIPYRSESDSYFIQWY